MRITRTGVVFVLGIVVLAGLVFGGILFVNQRGEQVRRDEAIKIAEQQLEAQSKVAKEGATKPAATETTPSDSSTAVQSNISELPTTGPEISAILVVTILALAGSFFVASQRAASRL